MSPDLWQWAARWGIHPDAVQELRKLWGMQGHAVAEVTVPRSEAWAQSACRLAAAQAGYGVWRNNIGAMQDENGRVVRYGLANDSKAVNDRIKSGDLIGCAPVTVTAGMVGTTVGQFCSWEIKEEGWHYTGTPRERAQLAWIELVTGLGGRAKFSTGQL